MKKSKETDLGGCFVALDFETADYGRDSACALSIVLINRLQIAEQKQFMIRPPRKNIIFTDLHGISWSDVSGMPDFKGHWPEINKMLKWVSFIAAHNAKFDRSVMEACCKTACIKKTTHPYLCTVKLARHTWNIFPTKLPDVCRMLKIELKHHDACSDALACAKIVLAAIQKKIKIDSLLES
ncbi:MAG: hypothetical protein A2293_14085 [Elusimicrobia bacterium RIFOXYB2_FULL_49_7]|nr:MAG: hypothetical protein A2293_14085 [Elusimicrobia bacterium RIFOXYB2_FULL_49_7]